MFFRNITPGRVIIPIDFITAYSRWQNGSFVDASNFAAKGLVNFIFEVVFIFQYASKNKQ